MTFAENLENAKQFAKEKATLAAKKTKELAAAAKMNISIYAEEDKIRKAQLQLGKLYYRDYAAGAEMDAAEYQPWCDKIDESKAVIEQLRERIGAQREQEAEEPAEPVIVPEITEE